MPLTCSSFLESCPIVSLPITAARHIDVARRWALAIGLVVLGACGSDTAAGQAKLDRLDRNIGIDSLFTLLGPGPLPDAPNVSRGYRVIPEAVDGQRYLIIMLREQPGSASAPLDRSMDTPIVLDEQLKIVGWGWSFYDSEGKGRFGKGL
jgi:hypothetical protein